MATPAQNHLDNIFHAMGELNKFAVLQFFFIAISSFPAAYQLLCNVFIARNVPHRCAAAPNGSSDLFIGLDEYRHDDLNVSYHQCEILVSFNHTVLKKEECLYGMEYEGPKDATAVSQFDLVCQYSSLAKLSQTLVIAGQGIGATFFTILSDRYGRKPILVLSNLGLMACGLVIAYAPNFTVFALFKFLVGTFQQGYVATSSTVFLEMMTTKNKRVAAFLGGTTWGVASMSLSFWAYIFRDHSWRTLQIAISLSSIGVVLQAIYLKESLRWLIANGRAKAVVSYIRCATKMNDTSFDHTMKAYEDACHLNFLDSEGTTAGQGTATRKLTLLDLLKIKRLRLNALIIWLAWFITALSFFSIYMMSTSLAGDPYLNYFLTSFMEVPNNFLLFYLLNRFGRKPTLVVIFVVISAGLIVGGVCQMLEPSTFTMVIAIICSCVGMSGASAAFGFVFFYTPEIFPTNMRNQAVGVSSMMGRVGGMIAPFTGVLSEKAKWAPGVMVGFCSTVVCVLSIVLPETRDRELPQTIEDVLAWFSTSNKSTEINDENDKNNEPSKII